MNSCPANTALGALTDVTQMTSDCALKIFYLDQVMRDPTAQMWNIFFCFPPFLCQSKRASEREERAACSTSHVCEAADTNARRKKVWGNATVLLDSHEERDELYLLFYLKVGEKIDVMLHHYWFIYQVLTLCSFCGGNLLCPFFLFFFKDSIPFHMYPHHSTFTLSLQILPIKITVICAIRCPFLQAPWCLSEFQTVRNVCSLSMSIY